MFENLTNKFEEIFSSLKKAPSLDERQVDEGLRNIRLALLEADVSLPVVKEFVRFFLQHASKLTAEVGYVPLKAEEYKDNLGKLN